MAGYSSSNIISKLGLKPGMHAVVMRAPKEYLPVVEEMSDITQVTTRLSGRADFVQYFATSEEQLAAVMPNLAKHLAASGMLWVSWVKRTSPKHSGLDDSAVRRIGLSAGLVDVKVASVGEDWSALKFVYRLTDR